MLGHVLVDTSRTLNLLSLATCHDDAAPLTCPSQPPVDGCWAMSGPGRKVWTVHVATLPGNGPRRLRGRVSCISHLCSGTATASLIRGAQSPQHAPYTVIKGGECIAILAHVLECASHMICIGWRCPLGLDAATQATDEMRAWVKQTVVQPQKSAGSAYHLYKGHAAAMNELCIVCLLYTSDAADE